MDPASHILAIDDEESICFAFKRYFSGRGHSVAVAASAREGLACYRRQRPDVVFLDVRLPDGTGVELCQKLREMRPGIPILYYSAYGDAAEVESALAKCGDAYLKKPVCIADIENVVAKLLATGGKK